MSENFETGLNELYTRAAAAHSDAGGFPTTAMVAVARRNRRARTAAVAVVTAAAVVGGGFGGAAAVRNLGDGVAQPAASVSPTVTGLVLEPSCGIRFDDLKVVERDDLDLRTELRATSVAMGEPLDVGLALVSESGMTAPFSIAYPDSYPTDTVFIVVQDGAVVGLGDGTTWTPPNDENVMDGSVAIDACDAPDGLPAPLMPGEYVLYPAITLFVHDAQTNALLLGEGAPFTVTDVGPTAPSDDATIAPDDLTHDVSAGFREGAPLEDGDYFAALLGVDAAGATIDVDLMVSYWGPAAEEYVAANAPGEEVLNDYYVVNDVEQGTTLPLAADAPVFENCFDEDAPGYFPRTVAEWASAPTSWDGLPNGPTDCSAGAELGHTTYYWLRIRDGVVVGVVGQWVP